MSALHFLTYDSIMEINYRLNIIDKKITKGSIAFEPELCTLFRLQ